MNNDLNLRFIKKITRNRLNKDFDHIYDGVKKLAYNMYNYSGEIKIISDNKWVKFYILDDGSYTNNDFEYNIDE